MIDTIVVSEIIEELNRLRNRVAEIERREALAVPSTSEQNVSRSERILSLRSLQLGTIEVPENSTTRTDPKIRSRKHSTGTFFELFFSTTQRAATLAICAEKDYEWGGINAPGRWRFRESHNNAYENIRPIIFAINAGTGNSSDLCGLWLWRGPSYTASDVGNLFNTKSNPYDQLLTALASPDNSSFSFTARASWQILSDRSLKKDIRPAPRTLGRLRASLWKHKNGNDDQLGFVAQEVEQEIPEAVVDVDGVKAIFPDAILAAAVNTIQELKDQIDTLTSSINELRQRLEQLEAERWNSSSN